MPQYSGVWTLQQQMQALTSGQWVTDPLFDYTTLLLQGDAGANGAQNNTFYDTSPNQFAITRNGNTTQGSFTPFSLQPGAWSNYFNGSSNLNATSNAAYNASTGDFCVEAWVYNTTAASALQVYVLCVGGISLYRTAAGYLEFAKDSVAAYATSTTLVPVNQWSHVAVTRSGTTLRLFIDGVQAASVTNSVSFPAGNLAIGSTYAGASYHTGYLSNVRYVVGSPVYTTNFTPSPLPLTAITNTVLLTCQSYRFVDNSTTANTLSLGSTPQVQPFSPFAPQYQWTSDVIGGSGYFDGTGDYLSIVDQAAFYLGTNNFTLEGWFYATGYPNYARPFGQSTRGVTGNNSIGFFFDTGGNGATCNMRWGTTTNQTVDSGYITVNAGKNQWHHLVATRDGNTLRMYFDGVQVYSTSVTGVTFYDSTADFRIGADSETTPAEYWQGYLSGVRLVNGTCLYPNGTTFTLPTTPPTAVTNTQLLANFTNAGIYDGTMKNNLETIGNASVSTSVVKYGSGSLYFDGTGDSLVVKDTAAVTAIAAFRAGDFTVEMWVYPTANPSTYGAIPNVFGTSDGWGIHYMPASDPSNPSTIRFDTFVSTNYAAKNAVLLNQWTHIAVTRQGTALKFWVNGVQSGSTATVTESFNMTSATFSLGNSTTVSREFFGYIDDFRITKGIARYTQNFIPPSVALPRQ